MAHYVTCVYCGERFDRDKIPTTQVSKRRYAHKECADKYGQEKTQEEKDLEQLEKYIMKLFDEPYINARIRKQLRDFKKEYDFTYSGMLKALIYWYEVKGNSTEKANGGIGIIPYIYKDAYNYYYNLWMIRAMNENKNIEEYKPKEKIVEVFAPEIRTIKRVKLFNLDDDGEE